MSDDARGQSAFRARAPTAGYQEPDLAVAANLLETGAAVHRLVSAREERYESVLAAVRANRGMHLSLGALAAETTVRAHAHSLAIRSTARLAGGSARRASARCVHQSSTGVELLLPGREHELAPTVLTGENPILV